MKRVIEIDSLDERLIRIKPMLEAAGASVQSFHNDRLGVFWRDSHGMAQKDMGLHPTSTSRCYYSLHEYLRYLYEERGVTDSEFQEVRDILSNVTRMFVAKLGEDVNSVRESSSNQRNMFTDAHLLVAVSLLTSLQRVINTDVDESKIVNAVSPMARRKARELDKHGGGKVHQIDDVHHFVTLHAVRGLDALSNAHLVELPQYEESVRRQVHRDTLELLAYDHAGVKSEFDSTELAFAVATLNRFPTSDTKLLTRRAVDSICLAQAEDGSWPTSRLVSYSGTRLLHVASYEVGLSLSNLFLRHVLGGDIALCDMLMTALDRTLELVENRYGTFNGISGWANDHIRGLGRVESWATAIVLAFLVHYRDAILELRQRLILQKYGTLPTNRRVEALAWPDMASFLRDSSWVDRDILRSISDPTEGGLLLKAVEEEVVNPIMMDWVHRPERGFLFLHGPPGTRKTSFAAQLAASLEWPIITLSPPDFLYQGLEGLEVSAAGIFMDLMRLRRVIALLDECEEFFRKRRGAERVESRTVGSFITAGMLPRIQRLRERHWITFIVVTNRPLAEIDDAVTRPGRFDFVQEIGYPTVSSQIEYSRNKLEGIDKGVLDKALQVLKERASQAENAEKHVSFSVLDSWIDAISHKDELTENKMLDLLDSLASQKTAPPLAQSE